MSSRRDFLREAIIFSGGSMMPSIILESIAKAVSIDPGISSTYLDAEHIVILMQENRSFDHCFGSLKGVRGFNDPRAITQPNGNLVWMQTNEKGETYVPFRFDIRNTKITWMGSTPHSRWDQVDAWNFGRYDKWLPTKRVRNPKYADMPLTLGFYNREDIPFHYSLADAFTICDQNFCSVMSSTDPNRIYFWSGTIRKENKTNASARIRNDFPGLGALKWKSFPERLQDCGISWKVYQNDITAGGGFKGEERSWLSNFGCNPLEWFEKFNVRFFPRYIRTLRNQIENLPFEIEETKRKIKVAKSEDKDGLVESLSKKQEVLENAKKELLIWNEGNFEKLPDKEKELHHRAFTINDGDPYYHDLMDLEYEENGKKRSLEIPKGDVLYKFREDVKDNKLPAVSWLVAPWRLIDHPSSPWYGSLYMSEILNILTSNPEVWKKTIFILTFDENDGYFDHIPPFVASDPNDLSTGKCSAGLNSGLDYIQGKNELEEAWPEWQVRQAPVGLGYRVPMIIASPWTRGGRVCSQVFDHTSTLQFLENFFNKKFGKDLRDDNITQWRRAVAGDLTCVFKTFDRKVVKDLNFLEKNSFYKKIYDAKFKDEPKIISPLLESEIEEINRDPTISPKMPKQETGIKPSCALTYELYVDGKLGMDGKNLDVEFEVGKNVFGEKSSGCPFNLYFPVEYLDSDRKFKHVKRRSYTIEAGKSLVETFPINSFLGNKYHIRVNGPNGFYREFIGTEKDPHLSVTCKYEGGLNLDEKLTGNLLFEFKSHQNKSNFEVLISDNAYKNKPIKKSINETSLRNGVFQIVMNLSKSFGWYDFTLKVKGYDYFERRYAGRVETGKDTYTDPFMGNVI